MFFGTVRTCVMPADRSIDIDTPYDLHVAEATAQYLAGESK
jgi:CMP-N-acetylneuraminic acid synthetase